MKHPFRALLLASVATFALPAMAADLPLKRVVVTTSGLALYQHEGTIEGDEQVEISARLDRVDDMLKSLLVLDSKGELGGVSLPGREPLSQLFRDLPFDENDLTSLSRLLNTLKGTPVSIDGGDISGRLLSVTHEETQTENGLVTKYRVSVLTDQGIKTMLTEDMETLAFRDPKVQEQLDKALESLFANRVMDRRTLTINLKGTGERQVGLAYIQDAPLWKSAYRLVLPQGEDDKTATLQGWAVMENTTGSDWDSVQVTLMSGSPVTYHQSLYESYHIDRPELPVKIMDRVMPRVDKGAVADLDEEAPRYAPRMKAARGGVELFAMEDAIAGAPPMPQAAMAMEMSAAPMEMAQVQAAASSETASQLLFTFPQEIDLPAGHTLMVPFVSHELPAEEVYVYQPETNARHPLASVEMKNESGSGLPPGILTLYDGGASGLVHVGDAEMPLMPKGESRFVSFALDNKTTIDREDSSDKHLGMISFERGNLRQKVVWTNTTSYTIKAPEDEARTLVLEHPRRQGWELDTPGGLDGDVEKSETHYRLRVKVPAGETKSVKVTLRNEGTETLSAGQLNPRDLDMRLAAISGEDIPSDLRKALEKVQSLNREVYSVQRALQQLRQERQQIFNDQQRIRQNLSTVSQNSSLGKRYLDQMEQQEDKLAALAEREEDLQRKENEARAALENYMAGL